LSKQALKAVLIAGPTASGKSALALAIARRLNGLVINADSMQVYHDLRIITARPTPSEEAQAPHALYGSIDAADAYSVHRWLADARVALERARRDELLPIIVGGTGLYFKGLTHGLSDIPDVPPSVRAEVRAFAAELTSQELHAALAERDPATAARLRPSDPQRLIRALEVHAATGASLAGLQSSHAPPLLPVEGCMALFLAPDREASRAKIDQRFDRMMADGALDEVRSLRKRRLDPTLPVMRAHGVPPLLQHLDGKVTLDAAVERGKADTRRYIKRQATFARHQLPAFVWTEPARALEILLAAYSS